MYVDLQQFCFHRLPLFSTRLALFQGDAVETNGKQNPKTGFKSPPNRDVHIKWLFLNNLRSKMLEQIQNLDPHRLMSR